MFKFDIGDRVTILNKYGGTIIKKFKDVNSANCYLVKLVGMNFKAQLCLENELKRRIING